MEETKLRLLKDHVITRCRDGRCYYDPEVKEALIRHAAMPGTSIPALAREHGITTNQLRRWVVRYREKQDRQRAVSAAPQAMPFVPVTLAASTQLPSIPPRSFCARLPNGIELDFTHADAGQLASLVDVLWKLPCSVSTRR